MKKTLWLLLVLVMCMSLVLSACNNNSGNGGETGGENGTANTEDDDKAVLVSKLGNTKLKAVVDELKNASEPDTDEIMGEVNALAMQMDLLGDMYGEAGGARLVIKDGRIYALNYDVETETWELATLVVIDDEYNTTIYSAEDWVQLDYSEMTQSLPVDNESFEEIETYAEILDGVTLPSLSAALFVKNGDWYQLDEAYVKDVLRSYITGLYVEMSEGETELPEDVAELVNTFLEGTTLQLSFAVSGEEIKGIKVNFAMTDEAIIALNGGGEDVELPYSSVSASFELLLNDTVTLPVREYLSVKMDMAEGTDLDVTAEVTYTADGEELASVVAKADAVVPADIAGTDVDMTVDFDASLNVKDADKANTKVLTASLLMCDGTDYEASYSVELENDADGVGQAVIKASQAGQELADLTATIDYDSANDVPTLDALTLLAVENKDSFKALAEAIASAYVLPEGEEWDYLDVKYYDETLDLTLTFYVDAYIDEDNVVYGLTVYQGNNTDYSCDYEVTKTDDGYEFTYVGYDWSGDSNIFFE